MRKSEVIGWFVAFFATFVFLVGPFIHVALHRCYGTGPAFPHLAKLDREG